MNTQSISTIRRAALVLAALGAALSTSGSPLRAQTGISCPGESSPPAADAACTVALAGSEPLQTQPLRVRVFDQGRPAAGAMVRFRSTSGALLPDSVVADTEGFAQTLWYRAGGAEGAAVAVDARTPSGSSFREIRLTRSTPGYALRQHSGNYESWFEKTPLRHPVVVEIVRADAADDSVGRITSPETCSRLRVAFTRIGTGSVTPDTVMAGVDSAEVGQNPHRLGCFARANWTLGEGPGRRHARMSLVGGNSGRSSVLYEAYARASPRLIGGIMATRSRSYLGPQAGPERTIRIERTLPDGSKASFDTTFATGRDTVKQVDGSWAPAAFVGVSTPIRPKWHRWALTFGVDPRAVDRNWYAGVSVLRIPGGLEVESLPVDIHLLGHWGRVDVLENPKACRERGECDTEDDVRWQGLAAMLSVDAGSVITDLIKKLSGS